MCVCVCECDCVCMGLCVCVIVCVWECVCVCVCVYGIAPLALVEGKDSPTRTEDTCWSGVNLSIDCDSLTARYSHGKKKILVEKLQYLAF